MKQKVFLFALICALQANVMAAEVASGTTGTNTVNVTNDQNQDVTNGQVAQQEQHQTNTDNVAQGQDNGAGQVTGTEGTGDVTVNPNGENTGENQTTNPNGENTQGTQTVAASIGTRQITLDLAGLGVYLDGVKMASSSVLIKNNCTYIPLRSVVKDIYGGELVWEKELGIISANIENLNFDFVVGSKQGFKNSEVITIDTPFVLENGAVYCPVKALPALFNMEMTYMGQEKKIILITPESYAAPVYTTFAEFEFTAESYIQGQTVDAVDKSYDTEGKAIVERKWMLDNDKNKTSTVLSNLFKTPRAGAHTVSLKVKNADGKWSDWASKEIMIIANAKPVVTSLSADKTSYAQGQLLDFKYTYENEEWEKVTEEKWAYKKVGEPDSNKVYIHPQYIFCEGDYEIYLQLKDEYGNWSDAYNTVIHITDEVMDTELNYKFTQNEPGTIIDNFQKKNYRDYEEIPITPTSKVEGTYILSDSPESVSQNGILYVDFVEGLGRVNFHHCNKYPENPRSKKIVVMAENVTEAPVNITLNDKIIKGPSTDGLYVGQLMLYDYFKGNGYITYTLQPGEKMFLIDTEAKNWDTGTVISGQLDFVASGKIKLVFAAVDKGTTTDKMINLTNLPKSVHSRGTFDTVGLNYDVTAGGDKERYFLLGKDSTEWVMGRDAITGETVANRGNYGITYKINVTATEDDLGIILNPRGGAFRGAVRINGLYTYLIPKNSFFGADSSKAAIVTRVKKGETVQIEYMLPNSSSSPILFGLIPKSLWK